MKNTDTKIGDWEILNPSLVVKLGLVLDDYKLHALELMWGIAEEEAKTKMPLLDVTTKFHQHEMRENDNSALIYSFRFYTPESNRRYKPGLAKLVVV